LFENIDVTINNCNVAGGPSYAYQAWMQMILGVRERNDTLSKELYFPKNKMDDFSADNLSFKSRKELAEKSKSFEMLSKPMQGIFNVTEYFPPSTMVTINMTMSRPSFCLSGQLDANSSQDEVNSDYIVQIKTAKIYTRKIIVHPTLTKELQQGFSRKKKAIYTFEKVYFNSVEIQRGLKYKRFELMYPRDEMPTQMCIGVIPDAAFVGRLNMCPFNFKPHGIKTINVWFDEKPLEFQNANFENGQYMLPYNNFCKVLAQGNAVAAPSYKEYLDGNFLFVLQTKKLNNDSSVITKKGKAVLEVEFENILTEHLIIVVMISTENTIEMGEHNTQFPMVKSTLY